MSGGDERDDNSPDDAPSMDPRTWLQLKPQPDAGRTDDGPEAEASFNPQTWFKPGAAPSVAKEIPAAGLDRRLVLGGGAAAALLGVGGLWVATSRKTPAAPAKAVAVSRPDPAVPVTLREQRVRVLSEVTTALRSAGVPPADIDSAAGLLGPVIGSESLDMRLSFGVSTRGSPSLVTLTLRKPDGSGARLQRIGGLLSLEPLASTLKRQIRVIPGEMDDRSFYSSAVSQGLDDSLVEEFASIFAYDFNFSHEIDRGDRFEAGIEQTVNDAGESLGVGRLVYASLNTARNSKAFYRFQPPGESEASWFSRDGKSAVRNLMRSPLAVARVTSLFGMRKHPVLDGVVRQHKGVDFGCPEGTPVFASADGVVVFAGPHGGHGNYVKIRHSETLETAYAHLSGWPAETVVGTTVRQGNVVAFSGNTGTSSGPHLHYEVWVDGQAADPLTYASKETRALTGEMLARFTAYMDDIDRLRRSVV